MPDRDQVRRFPLVLGSLHQKLNNLSRPRECVIASAGLFRFLCTGFSIQGDLNDEQQSEFHLPGIVVTIGITSSR